MIDTGKNGEFRYEQSNIIDQNEAEFGITPSQTVGPYVHIGLTLEGAEHLVEPGSEGAVSFTVSATDGNGDPIADAMFELWQADPEGIHNSDLDPNRTAPATADGFRGLVARWQTRRVRQRSPLWFREHSQMRHHTSRLVCSPVACWSVCTLAHTCQTPI